MADMRFSLAAWVAQAQLQANQGTSKCHVTAALLVGAILYKKRYTIILICFLTHILIKKEKNPNTAVRPSGKTWVRVRARWDMA